MHLQKASFKNRCVSCCQNLLLVIRFILFNFIIRDWASQRFWNKEEDFWPYIISPESNYFWQLVLWIVCYLVVQWNKICESAKVRKTKKYRNLITWKQVFSHLLFRMLCLLTCDRNACVKTCLLNAMYTTGLSEKMAWLVGGPQFL